MAEVDTLKNDGAVTGGSIKKSKKIPVIVCVAIVFFLIGMFAGMSLGKKQGKPVTDAAKYSDTEMTTLLRSLASEGDRFNKLITGINTQIVANPTDENQKKIYTEQLAALDQQLKESKNQTFTNYINAASLANQLGDDAKKEDYLNKASGLLPQDNSAEATAGKQIIDEIRKD